MDKDTQKKIVAAQQAGYSTEEINSYLSRGKAQPKKAGGLRGAALSALPIVGGAAGTVLGGVAGSVLPGAGNIAGAVGGGAVGSGLGEFLRQKLSGEAENGIDKGNIVQEGLFGAVPGIGKGIQAARAAKAGKTAVDVTKTAQTTEAAMQARKGLKGRVQSTAQQASQEGMGLTVGQSAGRGKVLTPDKADELQDFITNRSQQYGGIRAGKPIDQARDAQNVYKNVTKSLDDTLTQINRPVTPQETLRIAQAARVRVVDNPAIVGTTKTLDKFEKKIQVAGADVVKLEKIRREADDLAFTSAGAGKTSVAAQAHAVRDAIDEFITPLSGDYKAIKGDYTLARDALEATSKANKSAKGFKVPFVGVEIGKQTIPGVKNKVAAKLSGAGAPTPPPTGTPSFRPFLGQVTKATIPQAGTRLAGSALFGTPFVNTEVQPSDQVTLATPTPDTATVGNVPQLPQDTAGTITFSDPARVEQAYLQALAAGDTETAKALIKGFELFGQTGGGAAAKPLSAEASKVIATANSGLQSLEQLEQMIESGGVPTGTTIPGRGLFGGAGQAVLGTSGFDAAADNVADAMVRARTGAAATKEELALYRRLLPQAFDPPEVRQQKMQTVRDYFTSIANRTGSTGTDLEQLAATGV